MYWMNNELCNSDPTDWNDVLILNRLWNFCTISFCHSIFLDQAIMSSSFEASLANTRVSCCPSLFRQSWYLECHNSSSCRPWQNLLCRLPPLFQQHHLLPNGWESKVPRFKRRWTRTRNYNGIFSSIFTFRYEPHRTRWTGWVILILTLRERANCSYDF